MLTLVETKLKINKIVNGKIPELSKPNFQKMFIEDRMYGALPNMDSWIMQTWTKLNRFGRLTMGRKRKYTTEERKDPTEVQMEHYQLNKDKILKRKKDNYKKKKREKIRQRRGKDLW